MQVLRKPRAGVLVAIGSAPISLLASDLIIRMLEWLLPSSLPVGGWAAIEAKISLEEMAFAILVSPLLENLFVVLMIHGLRKRIPGTLSRSAVVSIGMSILHAAILQEPVYVSVYPGFFVMCLIVQARESRVQGYWLSVIHHIAINALAVGVIFLSRA